MGAVGEQERTEGFNDYFSTVSLSYTIELRWLVYDE